MRRSRLVPRARSVLAGALLLGLLLIGQHVDASLYPVGVLLTLVVVVLSFTFNNVSEDRPLRRLLAPLVVTWLIVGAIFGVAYLSAPLLTRIGG